MKLRGGTVENVRGKRDRVGGPKWILKSGRLVDGRGSRVGWNAKIIDG